MEPIKMTEEIQNNHQNSVQCIGLGKIGPGISHE